MKLTKEDKAKEEELYNSKIPCACKEFWDMRAPWCIDGCKDARPNRSFED